MAHSIELRVRDEGRDVLVYTFDSAGRAAEMIRFLADFFPAGEFIVQPMRH